jgi:hypothetical protein
MGAALSIFAVKQKSPENVREILHLRSTGRRGYFPEFKFSGASLPTGWYLVCEWHHEFTDAELARLSENGEVVACFVEEHAMVSRAAAWKDGRQVWAVVHDAELDLRHLEVQGTPPPQFADIRDEMLAKPAPDVCDYVFNIPVSLVADLTGFRYDERPNTRFEVLERFSWFKAQFGR